MNNLKSHCFSSWVFNYLSTLTWRIGHTISRDLSLTRMTPNDYPEKCAELVALWVDSLVKTNSQEAKKETQSFFSLPVAKDDWEICQHWNVFSSSLEASCLSNQLLDEKAKIRYDFRGIVLKPVILPAGGQFDPCKHGMKKFSLL